MRQRRRPRLVEALTDQLHHGAIDTALGHLDHGREAGHHHALGYAEALPVVREPERVVACRRRHDAARSLRRAEPEQAIDSPPLLEAARDLLVLVFDEELDAAGGAQA